MPPRRTRPEAQRRDKSAQRPDLVVRALLRSATPTGLEPAASAVTGRRANQLRYGAWMMVLALLSKRVEL